MKYGTVNALSWLFGLETANEGVIIVIIIAAITSKRRGS